MEFGGTWYPADEEACARMIDEYWAGDEVSDKDRQVLMGVVPHAGWIYSGSLTARVFHRLQVKDVDLVVVLGGHLGADDPIVAMSGGQWETPFGDLTVHAGFGEVLATLPKVILESRDQAYADNSIELQLPFVKYIYPHAEVLPIRVPPGSMAPELGQKLAEYLGRTGLRAVLVASTDLTHYGPNYQFEPHGRGAEAMHWVKTENDPAFVDAVVSGSAEEIIRVARERHNACSPGAVAALCELARQQGTRFNPLDYTTSRDVLPGDNTNFVGYLGGVFQ